MSHFHILGCGTPQMDNQLSRPYNLVFCSRFYCRLAAGWPTRNLTLNKNILGWYIVLVFQFRCFWIYLAKNRKNNSCGCCARVKSHVASIMIGSKMKRTCSLVLYLNVFVLSWNSLLAQLSSDVTCLLVC